jgi:hypothetical protein
MVETDHYLPLRPLDPAVVFSALQQSDNGLQGAERAAVGEDGGTPSDPRSQPDLKSP